MMKKMNEEKKGHQQTSLERKKIRNKTKFIHAQFQTIYGTDFEGHLYLSKQSMFFKNFLKAMATVSVWSYNVKLILLIISWKLTKVTYNALCFLHNYPG